VSNSNWHTTHQVSVKPVVVQPPVVVPQPKLPAYGHLTVTQSVNNKQESHFSGKIADDGAHTIIPDSGHKVFFDEATGLFELHTPLQVVDSTPHYIDAKFLAWSAKRARQSYKFQTYLERKLFTA